MLFSDLRVALAHRKARRREIARLDRALRALSEIDRRVYLLCTTARLPQEVVAERLGLTLPQVQQHLACALRTLATRMDASADPAVAPDDTNR